MGEAPGLERAPRGAIARAWRPAVVGTLIFLAVLAGYLLSFNVDKPTHNADWYIRYQVTCSIVERNAFFINPYDTSERSGPGVGGHVYAQYTLGQTTAMIPLYLLGRALAGVAHTNCDQRVANTIVFLTCKSLDLIVGALLAVLFYATARLLRYARGAALALTLLFAFGSSLWPDVLSSEEHTLESLFLLAAAYAALRYTFESGVESRKSKVERGRQRASSTGSAGFQPADDRGHDVSYRANARRRRYAGWKPALPVDTGRLWLVAMGLAAGLVFVTRVGGLIAIPIFALYLVALHARGARREARGEGGAPVDNKSLTHGRMYALRRYSRLAPRASRLLARDLALYGLGVLPSVLINIAYDVIRWGRPFQTGAKPDHTLGFPPWLGLPDLLVSPGKGLLWYTPAVLLLILAARPFWRRFPRPSVLFALICGVYLFFYANVNYWHGDPAWGPRYLYAILPYLLLPLGEVFTRWRGYRFPLRGVLVGVLALSFLVQFSAVTVSYWRQWHYIYGYHYDQVEDHGWGSNLHYWWKPEQSPILISLQGIAGITQNYVDHAPLLEHPASQRLSDPRESSVYQVYGQAAISLTDLDKLRYEANWNTFTPWWTHVYPWWNLPTVVRLALALLAIFLAAGALLLVIVSRADRAPRGPPAARDTSLTDRSGQNGDRNGNGHALAPTAILAELRVPRGETAIPVPITGSTVRQEAGSLAVMSRPATSAAPHSRRGALSSVSGLLPVGLAALAGALLYGSIADAAALRAAHVAPPLVRKVAMDTTVRDGDWAYRVLSVTSVPALPGGITPPVDAVHRYVVVRLRIYNMLSRPQHDRPEWFDLTDSAGLRYQFMGNLSASVGELYHQGPVGGVVPARSALDDTFVYQVRVTTPDRDLALLGPGIALVRLHR